MLKNVLNTDPEKRYQISDIRKHSWYLQVQHIKISGGIFIGLSQIPINTVILDMLCQKNKDEAPETQDKDHVVGLNFDFKKDYVVRCLNANKHNHITTSYYLLLKRFTDKGEIDQKDYKVYDDKAII